jgi:hypothetical protein
MLTRRRPPMDNKDKWNVAWFSAAVLSLPVLMLLLQ